MGEWQVRHDVRIAKQGPCLYKKVLEDRTRSPVLKQLTKVLDVLVSE